VCVRAHAHAHVSVRARVRDCASVDTPQVIFRPSIEEQEKENECMRTFVRLFTACEFFRHPINALRRVFSRNTHEHAQALP